MEELLMEKRVYICAICGKKIVAENTEEQAMEQFKKDFPNETAEDLDVVCEDCYKEIMAEETEDTESENSKTFGNENKRKILNAFVEGLRNVEKNDSIHYISQQASNYVMVLEECLREELNIEDSVSMEEIMQRDDAQEMVLSILSDCEGIMAMDAVLKEWGELNIFGEDK
jgi:DNA-directed RNA polymerase subunit RPC12/RpoP